eukprot:CAMPEP_0168548458 /NCGR_PEP_ID=MMETSP0413-20121227/4571_1 /TAXON_ID=136452 /ORGANISM="Filamoeba nolandi, Strain NC-AS-23-1" /LENGTH=202 /DNA_ID=CAMNT_0008578761 /DNA_START=755 /DNA_END=1359 /DNA_ORIENTATION=-
MNSRYPNATPEELAAAETCIVCLGSMVEAKKLPCGHILHLGCLRSWLERRQECPICRTSVFQEEITQRQHQQLHPIPPQNFAPVVAQQQFVQHVPLQQHVPVQQHFIQSDSMPQNTTPEYSDQKIELIERQIQILAQQVQELQNLVTQLKLETQFSPKVSSEDDMLQQAISESLRLSKENTNESGETNERDEIRKRRLLRFS